MVDEIYSSITKLGDNFNYIELTSGSNNEFQITYQTSKIIKETMSQYYLEKIMGYGEDSAQMWVVNDYLKNRIFLISTT